MSDEPDWRSRALCSEIGDEFWFPTPGGSTMHAKKICWLCDVRQECLDYALTNDERFGIWGGYSERERRRLKSGHIVKPARIRPEPRNPK